MLQRRLSATTIVLLFAVRIALGQAGTADLTGIISDSSGGLLNAAKVTATDTETRVSTETHTGAGGVYVVTNLRPSVYEVSAHTDGFQTLVRTGVTLVTGERSASTQLLQVGASRRVSPFLETLRYCRQSLGASPNRSTTRRLSNCR
jgi:hypothetical protein